MANIPRLRKLVTVLEQTLAGWKPRNTLGFAMQEWVCGTTACAIGHFALHPIGKAEGWVYDGNSLYYRDPRAPLVVDHSWGTSGVAEYFEISKEDAHGLFASPVWYIGEFDDWRGTPEQYDDAWQNVDPEQVIFKIYELYPDTEE